MRAMISVDDMMDEESRAHVPDLAALACSPRIPSVLAANRDEFHDRPSASADWWPGSAGILAGRDLRRAHLARRGAAAVRGVDQLQRRRASPRAGAPSRGRLVTECSSRTTRSPAPSIGCAPGTAIQPVQHDLQRREGLGVYESTVGEGRELASGVFGLSNHLLDTPWPKVRNGQIANRLGAHRSARRKCHLASAAR